MSTKVTASKKKEMTLDGSKSRNWCFTAWEDPACWMAEMPWKYWCHGLEVCPTTEKIHWQGYMELTRPMQAQTILNTVNKWGTIPIHLEFRKGNASQAIEYCEKDGKFTEEGIRSKQGERTDLTHMATMLSEGATMQELTETSPGNVIRYAKGLQFVQSLYAKPRTERTRVTVLWGISGSGKSHAAFQMAGNNVDVVTCHNGFIQGYSNAKTVIIEEFEDKDWKRSQFLQLIDQYRYKVNVKGGEMEWNPEHIIITSNFDPKTWFQKWQKTGHKAGEEVYGMAQDPAVYRRLFETLGNNVLHLNTKYIPAVPPPSPSST